MDELDRFLRSLGIGSGGDGEEAPEDQPIYAVAGSAAAPEDSYAAHRLISGAVRSLRRQGIPAWARFSKKGAGIGPAWLLVVRAEQLDRGKGAFGAYMRRVNRRVRRNPAAD
jgi:hypothetical protein